MSVNVEPILNKRNKLKGKDLRDPCMLMQIWSKSLRNQKGIVVYFSTDLKKKKNPSFKIAMSGRVDGRRAGRRAPGVARGLPFG